MRVCIIGEHSIGNKLFDEIQRTTRSGLANNRNSSVGLIRAIEHHLKLSTLQFELSLEN